jgi:type IV pilus assembly protein PilO
MANPFKDMSVFMQALVAVAIVVVLLALGVYLPFSPVQQTRDALEKAAHERDTLNQEVQQLQVYKNRYSELKQQMDALNKQLETLKTIVPEEKELDEFIRQLQGAAASANVQVRRLTAQAVTPKELYYEMPFEVQVDGAYFNILDFFGRLGRLSRIINVGDLAFQDTDKAIGYNARPGTTVQGTFVAVTFFTKPGDTGAAKTPAKPGGK